MAAYDLEEQEKIDDLKAWWNQYGNTISVGVILACVVIGGVQGWRWWAGHRAADASILYQAVSDGVRKTDPAKAKDAMTELADKFGGTAEARAAYQEALAALEPKSQYRSYVQVKLDAAGGPTEPTTSPAAATPSAPAASAAPATVAKP